MSESQGIPRTRVFLAQGKLGLLVKRALEAAIFIVFGNVLKIVREFQKQALLSGPFKHRILVNVFGHGNPNGLYGEKV